jgi:rSAM/selenodomain-associated transferase 2
MISTAQKTLSISIIIPVLNEVQAIGPCLDQCLQYSGVEILVVDGGSQDGTRQEIQARGLSLLSSAPGRGTQQHQGALAAGGEILLFLHCDTRLPPHFIEHIASSLRHPKAVAGAFRLQLAAKGWGLRCIEAGANCRSAILQMPYGDQALFMHRATYFAVGGFPCQPILEDLGLVLRLRKRGRLVLAPAAVSSSARRWQRQGVLKTSFINQIMLLAWALGISPERLARWYYGRPATEALH